MPDTGLTCRKNVSTPYLNDIGRLAPVLFYAFYGSSERGEKHFHGSDGDEVSQADERADYG